MNSVIKFVAALPRQRANAKIRRVLFKTDKTNRISYSDIGFVRAYMTSEVRDPFKVTDAVLRYLYDEYKDNE